MLKDELKLLAQLAAGFLSDIQGHGVPSTARQNQKEKSVNTECQRIKNVWTELLFGQAKDQFIRRYTWFHQQIILDLADMLYRQIEAAKQALPPEDHSVLRSAALLLDCLLDLRDFQIQYFNSYFNGNGKIPDAAMPSVRKRMADAAEELSASLQNIELDLRLKVCIRDYLGGDSVIDATPITYKTAEYLLSFIETLGATIAFEDSRDLTHIVTEVLFYMNFNHNSFCQWYQEDIAGKKLALRPADRLPMLRKQLLVLKSMPVMLTMGYDPEIPPVNVQLENWLNELIKQENYLFELAEIDQPHKIELKLTVAQLALLIRLFYEEGAFAIINIATLLRFFSSHFMTKKQEYISYGSMNKLYYSGDQFTGYAVRELLLKLVVKINKMFFPG